LFIPKKNLKKLIHLKEIHLIYYI